MLEKEAMGIILDKTLGLTVSMVTNDFIKKEVTIHFDNEKSITFFGCALVYDLGIIGKRIGEYSNDAGLGMKLELNKLIENSEEYFFCSLSRDFEDYKNKNEIRISFKKIEINF